MLMSVVLWKLTQGGSCYIFLLKNDYLHYRQVYFLKHKHEVCGKLELFVKLCEKQTVQKIKVLRTDNGKAFVNHYVKKPLNWQGREHQITLSYNPKQNGRAEQEMHTIIEAATVNSKTPYEL